MSTPSPQPTIYALSRDIFFGMRIRTVLQQLGYGLQLIKDEAELATAAANAPLALIDFNGAVDWDALSPLLNGDVPTIGFGSHTMVEEFRAAKAAGVTRVVSNGEFSRKLPELVEQYIRA